MADLIDELDDGIIGPVLVLQSAGVDTFHSCQGGGPSFGHAAMWPEIWFNGDDKEGKRAERIITEAGYQVFKLSRVTYERQGKRRTYWELQFVMGAACRAPQHSGGAPKELP